MRVKQNVIDFLKQNAGIRGRLCAQLGKSYPTIQRWVENNDEGLTLAASLKIISEEMGIPTAELLEDPLKV